MEPRFTRLYRIWHWTMAFSVIGLLFTVLLRKTFLSYKDNAIIIQDKLASLDINITIESAKAVGRAIRAPMWEWHYIFALFLGLSIALQIYMLLSKKAVFPLFALLDAPKEEKIKKLVHLLLCVVIIVMAVSGAVLYFHDTLGFTEKELHWLKVVHEYTMYGVAALVALHLAGVMRHEITTKEGIVSKMIHGDTK